MSYRKHPTMPGHWQIFVSQGRKGQKLVFVRECDEAEAMRLDREINNAIKGNRVTVEPTIIDTLPEYIKYYRTISTPAIVGDLASIMRRCLLPAFGKLMAKQVGRHLVHQYISDRLEAGVTHRTVEKELNYLSAMLKWMYREGYSTVKMDIPKPAKAKTKPKTQKLPMALDELSRFLLQLPEDRLTLTLLMSDAGLRCQEALRIRCEHIDLAARNIIIHGKGGKVVVYPILTKRLFDALEKFKAGRPSGWLVTNPKSAETEKDREPYKSLKTLYRLAAKRAGIEKPITHHILRHTYSSLLMKTGIPTEVRKELMRHSNLSTTEMYTFASPEWIEEQAEKFSGLIDDLEVALQSRKLETPLKPASHLRLVK